MVTAKDIISALELVADKEKAIASQRFFKTAKGQYAEGDKFIGVTVPNQRKVAKQSLKTDLKEVEKLLNSDIHEHRLTALLILVLNYKKAKNEDIKKIIVDIYLNNLSKVNNWDLVDSSAPYILGDYFFTRDRKYIYKLAKSSDLWEQRIAIMATFGFIRQGDFGDTLLIAEQLLDHKHDLIHKAVGWMLREIGDLSFETEKSFLDKHYKQMPRTMLRYAIEKFPEELRQKYLKGNI